MADGDVRLVSARPTIRINETEYPLLSANIERMRMREAVGGLSTLELAFTDWLSQPDGSAGYGATSGSPLQLGAKIKLYAGAQMGPQEIFAGAITALEAEVGTEAAPAFVILAEDALFTARRMRKSRTFEDQSPADVVRTIASGIGLTPEIRELEAPIRTWAQMNESDLAFLRRVLEEVDGEIQAVGDKLQAGPLAKDARAEIELRLGRELVKARATADLADQATEVRVGAFDPESGDPVNETVSSGELGPGEGRRGADILSETFGEVREHIGDRHPMPSAEARAIGKAVFGKRARRFVRLQATAQGDPRIRVGTWAAISGLNPFFNNRYVVTEAVHRFDSANGYLTEFSAESAFLGTPA